MRDSGNAGFKIEAPEEAIQLPFDEGAQQALIGHIMQKETFFKQTYQRLQPTWFTDSDISKIYVGYCEYYKQYDHVPTSIDEFKAWRNFQVLDQADRNRINNKITLCHAKTSTYGVDYLAEQLTAWQKLQLCVRNLPQIANLLNNHKIDKAETLLHDTSKDLLFSSFQADPVADWEDFKAIREAENIDAENAVSTGLSILDRKILPTGTKGSLLPGDTTVIIASANAGKSSCLSTIAKHSVVSCKSVLWITREGRQHDMMTKMYCCVFKKTRGELWQWSLTPEGDSTMSKMTKHLNKYLHYIHVPRVNAYVEDIVADILRMQAARQSQYGKGYDLVIVDYPAIFQTKESQGAKWGLREIQDYLYRQFVQLAAQEQFHCLLAAQTNREGSKVNKGIGGGKRLLSSEDVAECFGIIMSATNVLTINRDEKAQSKGHLTFYLVKSRSGSTGWAVTCKSNFEMATTHSESLGATAYRGNIRLSDQVDDLIRNYPNRDVPDGMIDGYKVKLSKDEEESPVV
jgi:replicative DNA helicase